jgi:hypothetical protein
MEKNERERRLLKLEKRIERALLTKKPFSELDAEDADFDDFDLDLEIKEQDKAEQLLGALRLRGSSSS